MSPFEFSQFSNLWGGETPMVKHINFQKLWGGGGSPKVQHIQRASPSDYIYVLQTHYCIFPIMPPPNDPPWSPFYMGTNYEDMLGCIVVVLRNNILQSC